MYYIVFKDPTRLNLEKYNRLNIQLFYRSLSRRFKGLGKNKGDGTGFKLPTQNEKEQIIDKIVLIGEKLYTVPSFSNSELTYTVDMNVGVCECHEGQN